MRVDEAFVSYILWFDRCVDVTAEPVYLASSEKGAGGSAVPAPPRPAPAPPEPATPGGASPGASKEQLNRWLDPPNRLGPATTPTTPAQ